MKCLRCDRESMAGRALCSECFFEHEAALKELDSDAWVDQALRKTRRDQRLQACDGASRIDRNSVLAVLLLGMAVLGASLSLYLWSGSRTGREQSSGVVEPAATSGASGARSGFERKSSRGARESDPPALFAGEKGQGNTSPSPTPATFSADVAQDSVSAPLLPTERPTATPTCTPTQTPSVTPSPVPVLTSPASPSTVSS